MTESVAITIYERCGSYVCGSRGNRASCTHSKDEAALRLARKLWPGRSVYVEIVKAYDKPAGMWDARIWAEGDAP